MIYAFLGLLLLAAVGTGGGYWHGINVGEDRYKAKEEAAQQKVQEQAEQLKAVEVQKQSEIVAAFDKGKSEGQAQAKVVYVKGAQYVAADKGLSNPVCVMSTDSLRFLQLARADLRTAAAAAGPATGLPGPGSNNGPVVRGAVQPEPTGRSPVSGMPQQPAQPSNTGQVPGQRLPAHPKPAPIN